jgi:trehalose synthase
MISKSPVTRILKSTSAISNSRLIHYKDLVGEHLLDEIEVMSRQMQDLCVIHYNTTVKGGGVAGTLRDLLETVNELGIKHHSKIVHLDESGCRFMAKLSELTQGGGAGTLTETEQAEFIQGLRRSLTHISEDRADVYWIHDIQLVPIAKLLPNMRPAVWLCHVDTANPNRNAEQFIRSYLSDYDLCVYNTPLSAFKREPVKSFETIALGIDVFGVKNREIDPVKGKTIMKECGIDIDRPTIAQVARFGRFKNPWQAIEIYRRVKIDVPQVQLALIGAMEATDDIEAREIYEDIRLLANDDPDIHLLSNPKTIGHPQVNAFQWYSDVILQRSTREGFGLTVTEAMWKRQPVIGTSATGFKFQIEHEKNGFIADDTESTAEYTLQLLKNPQLRFHLGWEAKEHVRRHFLLPIMVRDYLKLLKRAVGENR